MLTCYFVRFYALRFSSTHGSGGSRQRFACVGMGGDPVSNISSGSTLENNAWISCAERVCVHSAERVCVHICVCVCLCARVVSRFSWLLEIHVDA